MMRSAISVVSRAALAVVLAVGLAPAVAFAMPSDEDSGASVAEQYAEQARAASARTEAQGFSDGRMALDAYDYVDGDGPIEALADMPAAFDLRDRGVVAPVKSQSPWGTCWGFAAIAAAETSILSELGTTYAETPIDLSELQLAWFAFEPLPLDDESGQGGEGTVAIVDDEAMRLDVGGKSFTATSIFSSGIGPVSEEAISYRNAEGTTEVDELGIAHYSKEGDWSVDDDLRFAQAIELEGSNVLPCPASWVWDDDAMTSTYVYNEAGTAAIKSELLAGRAVQIGFAADASRPGQLIDPTYHYINVDTWAHYCYEFVWPNHAVTIVGWDDDYPKENFIEGHEPPADGAWIVKNSWGAESEEFPNCGEWGVDGTGYFYLSYYDQSLQEPETLDFFTDTYGSDREYYIANQYDYMSGGNLAKAERVDETAMANVFAAGEDQIVRTVAVQTGVPNTTVEAEVYLLDADAEGPTDGMLAATASDTFPYGGFHRIELADAVPVAEGQAFSVVVTEINPAGEYEVLNANGLSKVGSAYLIEIGAAKYYSVGVVNEGESYLFEDGEWTDLADVIDQMRIDDPSTIEYDYDNFPIKAYADPVDTGFADVSDADWYAEAVAYVAESGIMTGYGDAGYFGPLDTMRREDVAVMLFRYLAPDEYAATADPSAYGAVADEAGFPDVDDGRYYTPAVNWLVEHGIMEGYTGSTDAGSFGVGNPVTREEFAAIVYRALVEPLEALAADEGEGGGGSGFADAGDVSSWAEDAMAWCIERGVVEGEGDMLFPQRALLRCEAATMMMRVDMLEL